MATQVNAGTITSSPGPTRWRRAPGAVAVVQLVVASAWPTRCRAANAVSNSLTLGPWVSHPLTSGSRSACHSSSPVEGRAMAMERRSSVMRSPPSAALCGAPGDELAEPVFELDSGAEADFLPGASGVADAVLHERLARLVARRRRSNPSAARPSRPARRSTCPCRCRRCRSGRCCRRFIAHTLARAQSPTVDEVVRLAAVAEDDERLAGVHRVEHLHDRRRCTRPP